jgi:hypothetical protein
LFELEGGPPTATGVAAGVGGVECGFDDEIGGKSGPPGGMVF